VLTLERPRERPFDAGDLELCETIGLLLGPVFALKLRDEAGLAARAGCRARRRRGAVRPAPPGPS
jgi:hypothetical protein